MTYTWCKDFRLDLIVTRYVVLLWVGHHQFCWNYRRVR
jgi:hypothetical protein